MQMEIILKWTFGNVNWIHLAKDTVQYWKIFVYIYFIYSLFNNFFFINSNYIASNEETEVYVVLKRRGRGLI
jgi:hypothetical protein